MWLLSALVKKYLPEAKLKSFGLKSLAEEISIQLSIDCVPWSLVSKLVQIYNEKEEAKPVETQNVI